MASKCLIWVFIFILTANLVQGEDTLFDTVKMINSTETGDLTERAYIMTPVDDVFADSDLNIENMIISALEINNFDIKLVFDIDFTGSPTKVPILLFYDKNSISLENVKLNNEPITELEYDNYFVCLPKTRCFDVMVEGKWGAMQPAYGPEGFNLRGDLFEINLSPKKSYELHFSVKLLRRIGNYPFENATATFGLYIPSNNIKLNNLIVDGKAFVVKANVVELKSDLKRSLLVDSKYKNPIRRNIELMEDEDIRVLNLPSSDKLWITEPVAMQVSLNLRHSYLPLFFVLILGIFVSIVSCFIGYKYGSRQHGKAYVIIGIAIPYVFTALSFIYQTKYLSTNFMLVIIFILFSISVICLYGGAKLRR